MVHRDRSHRIHACASLSEMAELLTEQTWTLDQGFVCGPIAAINNSSSPDAYQEYAVFRDGQQVESITVSIMTPERIAAVLSEVSQ